MNNFRRILLSTLLGLLVICLASSLLRAQTADLRFSTQLDCATGQYTATMQIRASDATSFSIGTSSIFLSYDPASLTFVSYQSLNFDTNSLCGGQALWDAHSFDGSTPGLFNLTMVLNSSSMSCPLITNADWISIGTLTFKVGNPDGNPALVVNPAFSSFNAVPANNGVLQIQQGQYVGVNQAGVLACTPICSLTTTATPSPCDAATNQYSLSGTVNLSNAVAGNLTVSDGNISTVVAVTANQSTATFSLQGLTSDGASHTVTVSLPGCNTATATYTGPASCTDAASIIASSAIICAGSSATLTAITCTGTVSWNTGDTGPTLVTPALTTNTSYTATCTTASSSATAVGTVTVMVPAVLSLQTSSTLVAAGTPVNLVAVGCTGTIAWSTGERVLSIVVPPTTGTNVYSATCITGPCTIATSISIQSTTACTVGLTTSSLPAGTVGQPYSATLITTGGTAPYTFSMDSNSWPTGLTLNASTGVLSGVPTTSGSFSTTLHVTDSQSCSATMPLAMLQIGTAPICSLTATVTPGLCNTASNLYTLTGTIDLSNAATGNLTVSDGSTSTVVSVAANQATASFSLTGLNSDGIVHTVSASMSGCTSTTATYTAPQSCKTTPCSSGECFPIAVERAW